MPVIGNPMPVWLPLLLFALPGIVLAACAVNATIFPSTARPRSTIPVIALLLALLPTHLLALGIGSLSAGLAVAWTAVASAGLTWAARHRQDLCGLIALNRVDRSRLAVAILVTLPMIAPTILRNFHDDELLGGHLAIIAHLQNGTYPPRYLYEPSLPL